MDATQLLHRFSTHPILLVDPLPNPSPHTYKYTHTYTRIRTHTHTSQTCLVSLLCVWMHDRAGREEPVGPYGYVHTVPLALGDYTFDFASLFLNAKSCLAATLPSVCLSVCLSCLRCVIISSFPSFLCIYSSYALLLLINSLYCSLAFPSPHLFTSFYFTSIHFISFHFILLYFTSLQFN